MGEGGNGELSVNWINTVSVLQDERVPGMDGGGGYTLWYT